MKKPVLVVMAAGMGSRYGGLKQIDPVGKNGEIIIDYSLFDAMEAGFERVVFIINRRIEADFRSAIGERIAKHMQVDYVFQELTEKLPRGYEPPANRKKPWGTAHAILCCEDVIDGPFAAINADDYYGKHAFRLLYDRLLRAKDGERYDYCMVGFLLDNTLTDNGHVARGICERDEQGRLVNVVERMRVVRTPGGPAYTEDEGKTFVRIPADNLVSMNMWGFTPSFLEELESGLTTFLREELPKNPLKGEYYLPFAVDHLIQEGRATAKVLQTAAQWYGVTYQQDKPVVVEALRRMTEDGIYPAE